jgi:hypothetical protein
MGARTPMTRTTRSLRELRAQARRLCLPQMLPPSTLASSRSPWLAKDTSAGAAPHQTTIPPAAARRWSSPPWAPGPARCHPTARSSPHRSRVRLTRRTTLLSRSGVAAVGAGPTWSRGSGRTHLRMEKERSLTEVTAFAPNVTECYI